jgi:Helix-turn-helix domain
MQAALSRFEVDGRGQSMAPHFRFGVDPIIPLSDAALLLGCHRDTLKNEARRGRLQILKVSERRLGIRQSEFNRYVNSRVWAAA